MYSRAFMSGIQYIMNNNRKKANKAKVSKSTPLAKGSVVRNIPPRVRTSVGPGGLVRYSVDHREYVGDISGSTGFAVTKYSINPGLTNLFPWCSHIARQYESYVFDRLEFEFETQRSATIDGKLMLFVDYDAADPTPVCKEQLLNQGGAVSSPVRNSCTHYSSKANLRKFCPERYVRAGTVPAEKDVKTYDVGNLMVATTGCADTSVIGELYINYTVSFHTTNSDFQNLINANCAKVVPLTGITKTVPFGTTPVITGGLDISCASATLTFNEVGDYIVSVFASGTVLAEVNPTVGGTATSVVRLGLVPTAATTGAQCIIECQVLIRGQTLTLDFTPSCTTVTGGEYRVSKFLYSLA